MLAANGINAGGHRVGSGDAEMLINHPRRDRPNQPRARNSTSYRAPARARPGRPSTLSPTMRRRVAISVDHTMPETNDDTPRCHGRTRPRNARRGDDHGGRAGQKLTDLQDGLTADRLGHHAGEGAEQQHRHGARRRNHRDGEARSGDVQGEQSRRQQLEEAHRVDAAADRPQAEERGRGQQRAQAGALWIGTRHTQITSRRPTGTLVSAASAPATGPGPATDR